MRTSNGWSALLRSRNEVLALLDRAIFIQLGSAAKLTNANPIGTAHGKLSMTPLCPKYYNVLASSSPKAILEANGKWLANGRQYANERLSRSISMVHVVSNSRVGSVAISRTLSSKASNQGNKTESEREAKKEISTVEDPFDSPTYNIPEKPVTFTEGASYSVVILAGLGIAAVAGYAVFKELIFEPKEYKVFNKALKRIQDDSQVRVRIGSPITGYGQETRNRAARQRIANKVFTDEDGIEHIQIGFYIRGPHGAGKVAAEMFKDKEDKQWKYTYLIVQITQPSQAQLILESYIPAPAPVAA